MAEEKNVEAVETKEASVKDEVATKIQKQIQKKREKEEGKSHCLSLAVELGKQGEEGLCK